MLAKIYASYGVDGYKADFVAQTQKKLLEYLGNISIYDIRVYKHLTVQQVYMLTLSQAQFFESVMEENINAELGK